MRDNMTVEDAINVVHVLGRDLTSNGYEDVGKLVSAATCLVSYVHEQAAELEHERARRQGDGHREAASLEGHRLENGADGGGRRAFLAGRGVHAGETLYLLTYCGWHAVRYESNIPRAQPCLYFPLPGVREDIVFWVPREARFVWPEELRLAPRSALRVGRRQRDGVRSGDPNGLCSIRGLGRYSNDDRRSSRATGIPGRC